MMGKKSKKNLKANLESDMENPTENGIGENSPKVDDISLTKTEINEEVISTDVKDVNKPIEDQPNVEMNGKPKEVNENNLKVKNSSSMRRKISFMRKKKTKEREVGKDKDDHDDNKTAVKRSYSMSEQGKKSSKIHLPRFRSFSKKKHLSASADFDSRNKVLNSGKNDWMMNGLLDTVEKSNSMASLNTASRVSVNENTPPPVALVPPTQKKEENDELLNNENIIETVTEEATVELAPAKLMVDDKYPDDTDNKNFDENPENIHIEINILANDIAANDLSSPSKRIIIGAITENTQEVGQEDTYELYDDNISVSVRNLKDYAEEKHLDLPREIPTHDWLVLNMIASC